MQYSRPSSLKWILTYLIIGLFAYGAVYYFFLYKDGKYIYSPQSRQTQTQNIANQATNWKPFTYDQYKFEYPSAWNIWMTLESQVPSGCFAQGDSVCANLNGIAFSVNVLPWNENICKQYFNGAGGPKATLVETKTINGKQFYYGKFQDDNLEVYHIFYNKSCYELAKTISNDQDLDKIISSFTFTNSAKISEQDAVNSVKNLPEVKSWLALFNQPGGKSSIGGAPIIEVDHQDSSIYVVHVYEWVNQGADSHTATQGWYDVNKVTGEIKSEF